MATNRQFFKLLLLFFLSFCGFTPALVAYDEDDARQFLKTGDINAALVEYRGIIDEEIEDRNQKHGVDPVLLAEYGYTLALANVYDVALATLDEALLAAKSIVRQRKIKEVNFFIAEVFQLMEYNDLAAPFKKESNEPDWISENEIAALRQKYKTAPIINREDFKTTIKRVSKLTGENACLQALALSEELTFFYGKQPLSRITTAQIWEKLGFYNKALEYYTAVKNMGGIKDSTMVQAIDNSINDMRKKAGSHFARWKYKYEPQLMLYCGGIFGLKSASVSARLGFQTNYQLSTSLNFSYTCSYNHDMVDMYGNYYYGNSHSYYLGASVYKRFFNLLALGIGLNQSFGGGDYNLYVAPTLGFSFYKPRAKTSLDLFFNVNIPCLSDEEVQYNLSFGVTTYF